MRGRLRVAMANPDGGVLLEPGHQFEAAERITIPVWSAAELGNWREQRMSTDTTPANSPASLTRSIVSGRLQVVNAGAAAPSSGGDRRVFVHRGTAGWENAEIRVQLWGGAWDTTLRFQMGVIGRLVTGPDGITRGVATWHDILFGIPTLYNQAIWSDRYVGVPGAFSFLGGNGPSDIFSHVRAYVVTASVRASNADTLTLSALNDLRVDAPVIADLTDATYDGQFRVASFPTATQVRYAHTAGNDADGGTGTLTNYWPAWVAMRVVGDQHWCKAWRDGQPEPDWGDPTVANRNDMTTYTGSAPVSPPGLDPPAGLPDGPGEWGLILAHTGTNPYQFGEVDMIRLAA